MRLADGKTYKDYYVVIEIDGVLRNIRKSSGSTKLGYTEGITWICGRCTEYQFTLIFK